MMMMTIKNVGFLSPSRASSWLNQGLNMPNLPHFVCVCVCCKYCFRFPTRIYIFPYSILNKQHDVRLWSVTHKLVHVSLLLGQENGLYDAIVSAGSGTGLPGLQFASLLLAFQAVTSPSSGCPFLCFRSPREIVKVSTSLGSWGAMDWAHIKHREWCQTHRKGR